MINLNLSPKKSKFHIIIWMLFVIPSCVFSTNELHDRCRPTFSCGDQTRLFYPFWTSGREDCGHPDFKLNCSRGFAEISISSVKFRIIEANYDSGIIRLAISDYIGDLCPTSPSNMPFDQSVLQLSPNTELLTIFYDCRQDLSQYVPTYFGVLACGDDRIRNYYVTRSLSSPQLQGISPVLANLSVSCDKNVSIPASGPALSTLQMNASTHNLQKALEEGFELGLNHDCSTCLTSGGACGFNRSSSGFICHHIDDGTSKKGLSTEAISGLTGGVIMFLFLVLALFLKHIRKRKTLHDLDQQNEKALFSQPKLSELISLKQYSYAQVKRITKSFTEVVGRGGFGTVYRGTLSDGRMVAVKVLKDSKGNGEDFINEVASMSQTSHINIVALLGFCYEGSKRAILYEFLENGSLDKLISSKRPSIMDWKDLYGIALGVARGLEYLHHGCRTRIVHFDIKPHNVLLDDNLCPKVSDFGLAKLCEREESILSLLETRGTIGYIAPEVFSRVYGGVSYKSDVYSYGMLVLEMIGARTKSSIEDIACSTSSMYFPEWIYRDLEKADNGRLIEDGINNEEEEIVRKMTLVGLWCVQSWPSNRPTMNRVVEMMEGDLNALELPPRPVLQTPQVPFQEFSMISEDISVYDEEINLLERNTVPSS